MKNLMKFFALAVVILGFSATSFGQTSTVNDATASAKIIKALTITNPVGLDFGTIGALKTTTSNVILAVNNTRDGSADLVGNDGVAAEFVINGEVNGVVAVTLPSTAVPIIGTGVAAGGDAMSIPIGSWVTDQADVASVSLGTNGAVTLKVGATLNVGVDQKAGPYQGIYTVTVNYN